MTKLLRREKGQAAVETIFSIPIFLILFLIGFQLFCITWNSQYAHARSRYAAIEQAHHRPCPDAAVDGISAPAPISGDQHMLAGSQNRDIENKSYIVCH